MNSWKRTNLEEVEHILRQQFGEIDVACTGVDDRLYIFVTQEELVAEIRSFFKRKTRISSSAFTAKWIENIPKNSSGKTIYIELEQYYDV